MPLPAPIKEFVYAFESFGAHVRRTAWGLVATDPRYPDVYDANKACVLEEAPGLTLEEVRSALTPAVDAANVAFEHVEVMDLDDPSPALRDLRRTAGRIHPDAVMVHASEPGPAPPPAEGIEVRELLEPDEAFWRVYRDSRNEFGGTMPDHVVDQLVRRDREVLAPAGLRFFAGLADGQVVGFTTLLSIGGTGYLDNVVTLPAYRRRGVAAATITMAVRAGREAGDRQTFLLTDVDGSARALYERLGFRLERHAAGFTRSRDPAIGGTDHL